MEATRPRPGCPRAQVPPGRAAALLVAAALGHGCTAEPTPGRIHQPVITAARADQDLAVVALLAPGEPDAFCTATVVAPHVVLGAAHCFDRFGPEPELTVYLGPDARGPGARRSVSMIEAHPRWQGGVGRWDLAMVQLAVPVDPLLAVPLAATPATDHFGEPYRVAGFGRHDRAEPAPDGHKRQTTTELAGYLADGDVVVTADDAALCFGDSGGPGFLSDGRTERLAGVHSFTTGLDCQPPAADTRVDLYAEDIIRPWIDQHDPACAADGTCAPIGCTDDPDCAPCEQDGTCPATADLGQPCRIDRDCRAGLCLAWSGDIDQRICAPRCDPSAPTCEPGTTCHAAPPRGAACLPDAAPAGQLGQPCTDPDDCLAGRCTDGACATTCDPAAPSPCPDGFTCEDADPTPLCQSDLQPSSCAATPDPRSAATTLSLALLVLLGFRCRSFFMGLLRPRSSRWAARRPRPPVTRRHRRSPRIAERSLR